MDHTQTHEKTEMQDLEDRRYQADVASTTP
jgi:hypothetical protein